MTEDEIVTQARNDLRRAVQDALKTYLACKGRVTDSAWKCVVMRLQAELDYQK